MLQKSVLTVQMQFLWQGCVRLFIIASVCIADVHYNGKYREAAASQILLEKEHSASCIQVLLLMFAR